MKPYTPVNLKHRSILLTLVQFFFAITISIILVFGGLIEWSLSRDFEAGKVLLIQQCVFSFFALVSTIGALFIFKSNLKGQHPSFYEAPSSLLNQLNDLGEKNENIKKTIHCCFSLNGYMDITNATKIIQYKQDTDELSKQNKANKSLQNI